MNKGPPASRESFVHVLLEGRVDFSALSPFPTLSAGRVAQIDELLSELRLDDHDLVSRPLDRFQTRVEGGRLWLGPVGPDEKA